MCIVTAKCNSVKAQRSAHIGYSDLICRLLPIQIMQLRTCVCLGQCIEDTEYFECLMTDKVIKVVIIGTNANVNNSIHTL